MTGSEMGIAARSGWGATYHLDRSLATAHRRCAKSHLNSAVSAYALDVTPMWSMPAYSVNRTGAPARASAAASCRD